MTSAGLSVVVRRLWPRRVRARLAVLYAVLFLLAGTVLLALTYTLVASVLLPAPASTGRSAAPRTGQLMGLCKQREMAGEPPMSASLVGKCNRAFAAAGVGPTEQRDSTLSAIKGEGVTLSV
jgi:hypothetical protein